MKSLIVLCMLALQAYKPEMPETVREYMMPKVVPVMSETIQEYRDRGKAWSDYLAKLKVNYKDSSNNNNYSIVEPEVIHEDTVVEEITTEQTVEETVAQDTSSNDEMTYYGTMEMTAYVWTGYPCADGVYPEVGVTVACNNGDLWHKWIYIEGVGNRYVHDTGGMGYGVLDLYVGDYDSAIQVGRQYVNVYVLD